ncbi:MAG: hypothetical protein LH474_12605 [Chamaesiphon sp.]|nr:hypothetical protein [Chamaesiphon sp.]
MSSERQLQDRGKSAQEDSLGIEDARKIPAQTIVPNLTTDSDSQDDLEHLQRVELLTKKLQDDLNSVDTNATVD